MAALTECPAASKEIEIRKQSTRALLFCAERCQLDCSTVVEKGDLLRLIMSHFGVASRPNTSDSSYFGPPSGIEPSSRASDEKREKQSDAEWDSPLSHSVEGVGEVQPGVGKDEEVSSFLFQLIQTLSLGELRRHLKENQVRLSDTFFEKNELRRALFDHLKTLCE